MCRKGYFFKEVEFDLEVTWDRLEGRIDWMSIYLVDSDVELTDVLSEACIKSLEEQYYQKNPYGDQCPEDLSEDR